MPPAPPLSENQTIELPRQLKYALWRKVDKRLQRGDVLITTEHFLQVMEREFRKLVRMPPSPRIRAAMERMIVAVNEEHPETYLAMGIRNAVTRYLREMENRAGKQSPEAVEEGKRRIGQMIREGRVGFFLESIGVEVKGDLPPSVERAIEKIVSGERLRAEPDRKRRVRRRRTGGGFVPVHLSRTGEKEEEPPGAPVQAPLPDEEERRRRIEEVEEEERRIEEEEVQRAVRHLGTYVEQGLLTEEESLTLRDLYGIDERLARGEIDQEEAERLRSRFDDDLRKRLEGKLREAVGHAVHYINAFEALKRFPASLDGALRFLIRHEELVMAGDEETDMSPALEEVEGDEALLDGLARIMERKEHEARMLAAHLPPYRYVIGQGETTPLAIEEKFVEELRSLSRDELSSRLNAPEEEVRAEMAARIRSMIALIARLVDPTPFHRAVRRMKIRRLIVQSYRSVPDGKLGRRKVEHLLAQRVERMYPDIGEKEREALREEAEGIMAAIDRERKAAEDRNELRVYRA